MRQRVVHAWSRIDVGHVAHRARRVRAGQPQAESIAAARSLGMQGIKLADSGDCKGAIEKLSRAESLYHAPSILSRLGECQVKVGQIVLGTENLNRVVREQLEPSAPKAFRDAQERAKGVLAAALPKIAHLTVKVDPRQRQPADHRRWGAHSRRADRRRAPDRSRHARRSCVSAPGYLEQRTSVTLAEGGAQEISVKLEKDPSAVAATPPPPVAAAPLVGAAPTAPPSDTPPQEEQHARLRLAGRRRRRPAGRRHHRLPGARQEERPKRLRGHEVPVEPARHAGRRQEHGHRFDGGLRGRLRRRRVGVVLLVTGNNNSASLSAPKLAKQEPLGHVRVQPWIGAQSAGLSGTF